MDNLQDTLDNAKNLGNNFKDKALEELNSGKDKAQEYLNSGSFAPNIQVHIS